MSISWGVLALQGDFSRHMMLLERCGVKAREVRTPSDLKGLGGMILPGGESTTMSKMLMAWKLLEPIKSMLDQGCPFLATCAGLILLARHIQGWETLPRFAFLDISVERNAYGRQINSFEAELDIPVLGSISFPGVFIRAPRVIHVGAGVEVLASYKDSPVVLKQGAVVAMSFHPELTRDDRMHRWFLKRTLASGTLA